MISGGVHARVVKAASVGVSLLLLVLFHRVNLVGMRVGGETAEFLGCFPCDHDTCVNSAALERNRRIIPPLHPVNPYANSFMLTYAVCACGCCVHLCPLVCWLQA